jgi:hypothetical protein
MPHDKTRYIPLAWAFFWGAGPLSRLLMMKKRAPADLTGPHTIRYAGCITRTGYDEAVIVPGFCVAFWKVEDPDLECCGTIVAGWS